jgi:hypothetical protein
MPILTVSLQFFCSGSEYPPFFKRLYLKSDLPQVTFFVSPQPPGKKALRRNKGPFLKIFILNTKKNLPTLYLGLFFFFLEKEESPFGPLTEEKLASNSGLAGCRMGGLR